MGLGRRRFESMLPGAAGRVVRGTSFALAALALCFLIARGPRSRADSNPGDAAPDLAETGERFLCPPTGAEFRVLRDPATGRKALEGADGRRFDSVEEVVAAEEAALPPLRRAVDPALWPAMEDPAQAAEPVQVLLVLRRQPVHEASLAARERAAGDFRGRLAVLRRSLDRIAPLRVREPGRQVQLGDVLEEEARLLTPAEREEGRRVRTEVQARVKALRREILDAAGPVAAADQEPVVAFLRALPGARVLGTALVVSAVAAEIPAGRIPDVLEGLPSVAGVLLDREGGLCLDTSVPTVGAASWTGAGYDGSNGTLVAILDTGVDGSHPALSGAVAASSVNAGSGTDPTFTSTDDFIGHGTHVSGIVGSRDSTYGGVAPGVSLLNAKCFAGFFSFEFYQWTAGDWAATNGADVLNCSFGYAATAGYESGSRGFFDAMADDLGVSVAAAAGNGGTQQKFYTPGDGFNVVGVGAVTDNNSTTWSDNSLGSYGTVGPAADGRRKPDLSAPGTDITSCAYDWEGSNADWVAYTGTSMATPHVAGALGLLHDYSASWRPEGYKALLLATTRNTSPVPSDYDTGWGWGAMDLAATFTNRATVLEETFTSTGASKEYLGAPSMAAGSRVALCWNRHLISNGANAPTTYRALVDLDLFVYDGSTGALLGSSATTLNSVERVTLASAASNPILKVVRSGSFPSGQTSVGWALATDAGSSATPVSVSLPSLSCSLSIGAALVKPGQEFTADATITNSGPISAVGASVTLIPPPGYSILSGGNPRTISSIGSGGGQVKVTWTVRSDPSATGSGLRSFSAAAAATSFGETVVSGLATAGQTLDADLPHAALAIQGGAEPIAVPDVVLLLQASDDTSTVPEMRLRNAGDSWRPWEPLASQVPWTLPAADGLHGVEAQVRDAAGNESAVATGSVFLDRTAPTGSFVLSGDAEYLLPSLQLRVEPAASDGNGSGIRSFRWRAAGEADWSDWIPSDGAAPVVLPRPDGEVKLAIEGQFEDAAGNESAVAGDSILVLRKDTQSVTAAKSFSGLLAPGGDIDVLRLGALEGDVISVTVAAKAPRESRGTTVAVDLWDPSGTKVADGRYPEGAKRPGLRKYVAAASGEYTLIVRAAGPVADPGVRYRLGVKVVRSKDSLRLRGAAVAAFGQGAIFSFPAVEGMTLSGTLIGSFAADPSLRGPDGTTVPCPLAKGPRASRRISGVVLAGGSGTFDLVLPVARDVEWDLRLAPPKPVKLEETGE